MPAIELHRNYRDVPWVHAIMLFPEDETLRDRFYALEISKAEVDGCSDKDRIELDAATLRLLTEPGATNELVADQTKKAIVSGDVLAGLYIMQRFDMPEPSMNKAIFLAECYAKRARRFGDGSRMDTSERRIREYWKSFKAVAHLWAALRLNSSYRFASHMLSSKEGFERFLQVAAGILEFGTVFVPYRQRGNRPVLDAAQSWTLPATVEPLHLNSRRRPTLLENALKKYRAPQFKA